MSDFINSITDDDIESIGLKVIRGEDNNATYIQICDSESIFDDKKYTCHYEILHMKKDDLKHGNHKKNYVYVEIHFENKPYSKHLKTTIEELEKNDNELETFNWKSYCPGLRLKKSKFTIKDKNKDKKKVLKNLEQLKEKTIDHLLYKYKEIKSSKNWISSFSLENIANKRTANKRALSKYISEPKEIYVVHEKIKEHLIKRIKKSPNILGKNLEIDINSISEEHEVNKINYIDLVAKSTNEQIIFFEIKTVPDARLCIRQALGQLMEYSYFPNTNHAQKLIVVGIGEKTEEIRDYIEKLNNDFNIPINYLQIKL